MVRIWIGAAGLLGAGTVVMATVTAHLLAGQPPGVIRIMDSGVQVQGWHALALLGAGLLAERWGSGSRRGLVHGAAAAFLLGTVLFCGAVYSLALAGVSFGPVAPTGGLLLIAGWLMLTAAAIRRR